MPAIYKEIDLQMHTSPIIQGVWPITNDYVPRDCGLRRFSFTLRRLARAYILSHNVINNGARLSIKVPTHSCFDNMHIVLSRQLSSILVFIGMCLYSS